MNLTEYQQACAREIDEIIFRNPIKFEDFFVGERIKLYFPLKGFSKLKFEENEPTHRLRELFRISSNYCNPEMWNLFWNDSFLVYDKNEKEDTLRISRKPKNYLDLFPAWIDFRYFEK